MAKRKKYAVTFTVDATVIVEVEAANADEAKALAWDEVSAPCLCHQCADEMEVGDVIEAISVDERD